MNIELIPFERGKKKIVCSVPLPPFNVGLDIPKAEEIQLIPLGNWGQRAMFDKKQTWVWPEKFLQKPDIQNQPPRRCLLYAEFDEAVNDNVIVKITPGQKIRKQACDNKNVSIIEGDEIYYHRNEKIYHYVKREDAAEISNIENKIRLRLGINVNGEHRYWQWCEVIPAWSGELASAYTVGGHIYAGKEDRPMTIKEAKVADQSEFFKEATISAKAFVVVHNDGLFEFSVHFANIQGYGMGSQAYGVPFVEVIYDDKPLFQTDCGNNNVEESNHIWRWQPLEATDIFLGERLESIFIADIGKAIPDFVKNSGEGLSEGAGCSFEFSASFAEVFLPVRCLAEAKWYKNCGEFGLALRQRESEEYKTLMDISELAVEVFLRNKHDSGICRGGIYRYLDKDHFGRYEFSMDGNESIYIYRGAYMRGSEELYELAENSVKFINDIALDHNYFNIHYHGDAPSWNLFSLIYLRFGGMVNLWLETGNPLYLENAKAVAGRWIAVNRQNQPRKNMGRDNEPVEGILALYDATGIEFYWEEMEKVAYDTVNSLYEDNFWRSGFGVGPYWGINALRGQAWNGSHLFAGICEFLFRACPETCEGYDFLLEKACAMAKRIIQSIDQDYHGFHRTSCSYLPRRILLVAHIAKDAELLREVHRIIRAIETDYFESKKDFFKAGHHCAAYLDSPFVAAAEF